MKNREAISIDYSLETPRINVDLDKLDIFDDSFNQDCLKEYNFKTIKPYKDLKIACFDIETSGLDSNNDRVYLIGVKYKNHYHVWGKEDEKNILENFIDFLKNNPEIDVLSGHNIFNFDIPFIVRRCEIWNIIPPFIKNWMTKNEDGEWVENFEPKKITNSRVNARPISFIPYEINNEVIKSNTSLVDTYFLVAIWDFSKGKLNSYTLKNSTIQLGFREDRRLELNINEIRDCWVNDKLKLVEYLKFDLDDTEFLINYLLPPVYYQRAFVPLNIQKLTYTGNASKWQKVVAEYYKDKLKVLPDPDPKHEFQGGMTGATYGFFKNVAKVDVGSLYPSIMLKYGITSRKDIHKIILSILKKLRAERLVLKKLKHDFEAQSMQDSMKIMINSCFGFTGTNGIGFNDYEAAALITGYGRKILTYMVEIVKKNEGSTVTFDTDGCYIVGDIDKIEEDFNTLMPKGIDVELETRADWIYIPATEDLEAKRKNYIYCENNEIKAKGITNKRNINKLQKTFRQDCIVAFLESKEQFFSFVDKTMGAIKNRTYPIENLKITQSPGNSKALKEIAEKTQTPKPTWYMSDGGVIKSIEEYSDDYDINHYLSQLKTILVELIITLKTTYNYRQQIGDIYYDGKHEWVIVGGDIISRFNIERPGKSVKTIKKTISWKHMLV